MMYYRFPLPSTLCDIPQAGRVALTELLWLLWLIFAFLGYFLLILHFIASSSSSTSATLIYHLIFTCWIFIYLLTLSKYVIYNILHMLSATAKLPILIYLSRTHTTLFSCMSSILKGMLDNVKIPLKLPKRFTSLETIPGSNHFQITFQAHSKSFHSLIL